MPAPSGKISQDFTRGSIPKQLIRFAVPFMASNALQVLYSLVDMIIVGRYVGSFGLSAVSIASQITMFCTAFCLGFSTGGQVLIAQLLGSGRRERLNSAIGTLFSTLLLLGLVFSAVLVSLSDAILTAVHAPGESYAFAKDYLLVCGGGILATFGYNMVSAVLRGMGDSRHPFLFISFAAVLNLALDMLFTAALGWGVFGAALATVLSQLASFLFAVVFLYRRREEFGFDFKPSSFRIHGSSLATLTKLGIPFAVQSCAINLSMIYVNSLVSGVGVYASATFGVGVKLDDIVTKISQGIMYAVSPMVGQNFAAGDSRRVRDTVKWAAVYSGTLYIVFTTLYLLFNRPMFALFTEDPNVIALAPVFVSAVVWGFPALAIMRATGGFIQGIGNAMLMLVLGLMDGMVLRISLSWLFGIALNMGLYGFILGYTLASYGFAVPALIYFLSGKWEKRRSLAS